MYLSQLLLNPRHPAARRDLADPYQMHRTLSRVYADGPDVRPGRFLWRLERAGSLSETGVLLAQSASPGHWRVLTDLPGYVTKLDADKPYDLERWVVAGRRYRFRLTANPTVTRNGKRIGLLNEVQRLAWLNRQAQRGGFEIADAVCSYCDRIETSHGGGMQITVARVWFDGELVATEPAALRQSLQAGIGHAKALGLGLLSIARI